MQNWQEVNLVQNHFCVFVVVVVEQLWNIVELMMKMIHHINVVIMTMNQILFPQMSLSMVVVVVVGGGEVVVVEVVLVQVWIVVAVEQQFVPKFDVHRRMMMPDR